MRKNNQMGHELCTPVGMPSISPSKSRELRIASSWALVGMVTGSQYIATLTIRYLNVEPGIFSASAKSAGWRKLSELSGNKCWNSELLYFFSPTASFPCRLGEPFDLQLTTSVGIEIYESLTHNPLASKVEMMRTTLMNSRICEKGIVWIPNRHLEYIRRCVVTRSTVWSGAFTYYYCYSSHIIHSGMRRDSSVLVCARANITITLAVIWSLVILQFNWSTVFTHYIRPLHLYCSVLFIFYLGWRYYQRVAGSSNHEQRCQNLASLRGSVIPLLFVFV